MPGKLIIICGLPGSGKTTHARALEQSLGAVRLSADDWMHALDISLWDESFRSRVEALQWTVGQRLLALGQCILIEWGTWGRSERDALRERAVSLGATVELHYLHEAIDVLHERIQRRKLEDPPATREQIASWSTCFQAPTAEEAALYDCFWSNHPL